MAVVAWVMSGATVRLTFVPGLAFSRLRVTPGKAPVTVFDALTIWMPSMVRDALAPVTAGAKVSPPATGATVKLLAAPDVSLTIASLAPVASVMTLAVTPRPSLFMVLATSVRVLVPVPVDIVVVLPVGPVMVKLPAAKGAVALETVPEAQEAVLARLLTTTVLFPAVLPDAADAETMPESEEVTVIADKGPVMLLRDCISLSRLVASVWIRVKAVI